MELVEITSLQWCHIRGILCVRSDCRWNQMAISCREMSVGCPHSTVEGVYRFCWWHISPHPPFIREWQPQSLVSRQGKNVLYELTLLVDHEGLFIFVNGGYLGLFHDVTILKNSWVEEHWRELFTNNDVLLQKNNLGTKGIPALRSI